MYVVYQAYDDNTADIIDIGTMKIENMMEKALITFGNHHDVLGLSTSGHKLNYINAYNCLSFPTEDDANDYIRDMHISYKNKIYANNLWWIFEKKDYKIHVSYYVVTWAGEECTYVAEKGYTPYIQAALEMDKKTACEQAIQMTRNSKTGKRWTVQRIVR